MSKNKNLIPHKQYRVELNRLTRSLQKGSLDKEKKVHSHEKTLLDFYWK